MKIPIMIDVENPYILAAFLNVWCILTEFSGFTCTPNKDLKSVNYYNIFYKLVSWIPVVINCYTFVNCGAAQVSQ